MHPKVRNYIDNSYTCSVGTLLGDKTKQKKNIELTLLAFDTLEHLIKCKALIACISKLDEVMAARK